MRKFLAIALMAGATSSGAFAADLPMRTAPVFAPPPPPVFTWTGGYFGINAGYAFDYNSRFVTSDGVAPFATTGVANAVRPRVASVTSDGFTAGGQVGYNYQFGAGSGIVVGVEADIAYTDLGQTNVLTLSGNPPGAFAARNNALHTDMDFLGTVRGRVGYAFDRFLVYGTGGFAYGDVTEAARFFSPAGGLGFFGRRSSINTGYAYGGGVEYAMPTDSFLNFFHSSAVTIKAEYLHYDLGTVGLNVPATGLVAGETGTYTQRISTDGDLVRVGLNYKF